MKQNSELLARRLAEVADYARRRLRCADAAVIRWFDPGGRLWYALLTKRFDSAEFTVRSFRPTPSAIQIRIDQLSGDGVSKRPRPARATSRRREQLAVGAR